MNTKNSFYFLYILRCTDGTLYTGITTDVKRRVDQHNGIIEGGARYTRARGPVKVVYQAEFPDRSSASKEEYRIKQLSKEEKEQFIQQNP